jgi:ParB-like chromosome segregation protein Spo0J
MAARKLGLKEVPVIELGHLTPEQKKAYILATTVWPRTRAGTMSS